MLHVGKTYCLYWFLLDVYKRQRQPGMLWLLLIELNSMQHSLAPGTLRILSGFLFRIKPVSYTHLDVYKRQPTDMDGNSAIGNLRNNSLKFLAEGLAANGVASLRFDKRGIGTSASACLLYTSSLEEAVVKGLASDKGLYMPKAIKPLPQEFRCV